MDNATGGEKRSLEKAVRRSRQAAAGLRMQQAGQASRGTHHWAQPCKPNWSFEAYT